MEKEQKILSELIGKVFPIKTFETDIADFFMKRRDVKSSGTVIFLVKSKQLMEVFIRLTFAAALNVQVKTICTVWY